MDKHGIERAEPGKGHRSSSRYGRSGLKQVKDGTAVSRFRRDLSEVILRYFKRTSTDHKRMVGLLILAGALLRGYMLFRPITADEAIAFISFSVKPIDHLFAIQIGDLNHVFHNLLTKISTGIFGTGLLSLRLPAYLAGVLVLPMFYFFVRAMFNRYIALMTLALCAASPGLIELSALAQGYSITWFLLVAALLLGRYMVKENNRVAAVLIGVACAFGTWAVPSMLFGAIMIYLWLLFSLMNKYERSLGDRLGLMGLSFGLFVALTVLLYLPVLTGGGFDRTHAYGAEGRYTWDWFSRIYPDQVLELWVWMVDPSSWWVALIGFACVVQAAYVSAKYRTLIIALALGAVPIVLLLKNAAPPMQWSYTLFIFHLGMAIGLFYLLKLVQDKLVPSLAKRTRTMWAGIVIFLGFAVPGMISIYDRVERLPEAARCSEFLVGALEEGDRVCIDAKWEAAVAFHFRSDGRDLKEFQGKPGSGRTLFAVISAPHGQSFPNLLFRCAQQPENYGPPEMVKDWPRMEIFAARLRDVPSQGEMR